jgi:carboxylesterase type B
MPVVEDDFGQERFLSQDPSEIFRSGDFNKVPVIVGRTENEFRPLVSSNNDCCQMLMMF